MADRHVLGQQMRSVSQVLQEMGLNPQLSSPRQAEQGTLSLGSCRRQTTWVDTPTRGVRILLTAGFVVLRPLSLPGPLHPAVWVLAVLAGRPGRFRFDVRAQVFCHEVPEV